MLSFIELCILKSYMISLGNLNSVLVKDGFSILSRYFYQAY